MLKKSVIALIAACALSACGQNTQSEDAAAAGQEIASGGVAEAGEPSAEPAQAGGECESQPGRPSETLNREWAGEFVVDATPGTTTCAPPSNFVVTCNVRGPARVWADGDSYTNHSVVPEGQTATFTLSGAQSRCVLNGS